MLNEQLHHALLVVPDSEEQHRVAVRIHRLCDGAALLQQPAHVVDAAVEDSPLEQRSRALNLASPDLQGQHSVEALRHRLLELVGPMAARVIRLVCSSLRALAMLLVVLVRGAQVFPVLLQVNHPLVVQRRVLEGASKRLVHLGHHG